MLLEIAMHIGTACEVPEFCSQPRTLDPCWIRVKLSSLAGFVLAAQREEYREGLDLLGQREAFALRNSLLQNHKRSVWIITFIPALGAFAFQPVQ